MNPSTIFRGPTVRALIKSYLLVGLAIIVFAITLISLHITREMDEQSVLTTRLLADLVADRLFSQDPAAVQVLRDAMNDIAVPVILTNAAGKPFFWNPRQLGIPFPDRPDVFADQDISEPTDPTLRALLDRVTEFDGSRDPLPVRAGDSGDVSYYLHYGESALSRRLAWLPWMEAGLIVAFMGVALFAFRNLKRSEERSIWVGMAKETAHQMGTPLTSMSGWLALLGEEVGRGEGAASGGGGLDHGEVLSELERDHQRLAKVSARFSQIGSRPKLISAPVDELVQNACSYFQRRLPHLGSHVTIISQVEQVPLAPINTELLEWALENLIKNALDAIDKEKGRVEVSCRYDEADLHIVVAVKDNGKGMSAAVQHRVFEPGFSTREGGWGLGLVLVQRIVRDYHGGRAAVVESAVGIGTTMEIRLKTR